MKEESVVNTTKKQLGGVTGKGFMPGVSGNPAGKPKGTKHLSTLLWEALQERARNKDGSKSDKTHADLVIARLIKDNIEKGSRTELIFDRIDGYAKQEIDVTTGGESLNTTPENDVLEIARRVSAELKAKKCK